MPEIKMLAEARHLDKKTQLERHIGNIVNQYLCHFDIKDREEEREKFLKACTTNEWTLLSIIAPELYLRTLAEKILEEKGLL